MALLWGAIGFGVGVFGASLRARDQRAAPWRKMRVEHEGVDGATTRTRVIFDNPKVETRRLQLAKNLLRGPWRAV